MCYLTALYTVFIIFIAIIFFIMGPSVAVSRHAPLSHKPVLRSDGQVVKVIRSQNVETQMA